MNKKAQDEQIKIHVKDNPNKETDIHEYSIPRNTRVSEIIEIIRLERTIDKNIQLFCKDNMLPAYMEMNEVQLIYGRLLLRIEIQSESQEKNCDITNSNSDSDENSQDTRFHIGMFLTKYISVVIYRKLYLGMCRSPLLVKRQGGSYTYQCIIFDMVIFRFI